jgi:UDP-GlcNAc:undecaprenyl-phosphate GlcNAc-1-phosphate transferase
LPALYAFALVGALAGFLFYNFPPAKIFMGDSGSTYLGFMLAILPLLSRDKGNFDIQLFLGVTIVLIPIYDTFSAIWRRLKARVSIIQPDKWHLHHKLLHMGIGRRSILALVYASTMALGTLSILSTYLGKSLYVIITVCAWLVVMVLFFILHFFKERFISRETVDT